MAQIPKGRSVKGPYKSICRHLCHLLFRYCISFQQRVSGGAPVWTSGTKLLHSHLSCTSIGSDTAWGAALSLVALLRGDLGENG